MLDPNFLATARQILETDYLRSNLLAPRLLDTRLGIHGWFVHSSIPVETVVRVVIQPKFTQPLLRKTSLTATLVETDSHYHHE